MTFKLDTSGSVGGHSWSGLLPFTQGYIEALFAGLVRESAWGSLPMMPHPSEQGAFREVRFSDLAPEALERIIADCEALRRAQWGDKSALIGGWIWQERQMGHLNRFPPLTVQLGDDGKARFA